ncbi:unnamed protein product [Adineta ricciae]|uniref:ubiquitinyl hydrolase 1 n=1 Tax=Adineta ricciae TaxID=249248 RepID=A0A814DNE6_ADIRI|nr:unnamed protein product [Adineta ricciae]
MLTSLPSMSQSQSNDRTLYKFQELTGLNLEDCIYFLTEYNWNLQRILEDYYNGKEFKGKFSNAKHDKNTATANTGNNLGNHYTKSNQSSQEFDDDRYYAFLLQKYGDGDDSARRNRREHQHQQQRLEPKDKIPVDNQSSFQAIYHEKQEFRRCGIHSLNNLFQIPHLFTYEHLETIIREFNKNSNHDYSQFWIGDYDLRVLIEAIKRCGFNVRQINFYNGESLQDLPWDSYFGLLININGNHWFTIKNLQGIYYNLDSTFHKPSQIGSKTDLNITFVLLVFALFSRMTNQFNKDKEPLVVLNNVKTLSTKSVERYCRMYDKDLCCFRRKTLSYHPCIHVLFSSMITAKNFLNDRPHYIQKCRVNASLLSDARDGPNFVFVSIGRYIPISEDSLFDYTSIHFGRVLNCILYDTRGYAFIEFAQVNDANRAIRSSNHQINGYPFEYYPRNHSSKMLPQLTLTRLVHIGNYLPQDQEKLSSFYFPHLKTFTIHQNCYGQMYILGLFDINDSIKLLFQRAFCLNGRVLNIFNENDDQLNECANYLLVRNVASRLTDYNLLEYFSQFGRVLNCHRYGQTNAYRIQYRDRQSLTQVLEYNRIHAIKSVQVQIERE